MSVSFRTEIDEEWSVGDYVLSGGELPAMIMIDAVARFVPGVLGHAASAKEDSLQKDYWIILTILVQRC